MENLYACDIACDTLVANATKLVHVYYTRRWCCKKEVVLIIANL